MLLGPKTLIFIASLLSIWSTTYAAGDVPSPADAAALLLESYRARMSPEDWRCEVQIEGHSTVDNAKATYLEAWDVWLSRDSLKAVPASNKAGGTTWQSRYYDAAKMCIGCYGKGTLVHYPTGGPTSAGKPSLSIYDETISTGALLIVDPREVGLVPAALGHGRHMDMTSFYQWRPEDIKVEPLINDGFKLDVIGSALEDLTFEFRSRAEPPSKIRSVFLDKGTAVESTIEVDYDRIGNWHIPAATRFERREGGNLVAQEECKIKTITYGQALELDTFTIATLGVPENTRVNWGSSTKPPGDPGSLMCDGEKIVASKPFSEGERIKFINLAEKGYSLSRLLLITANLVVVVLLAWMACSRALKKRT